jgi:hypothetical protein
MKRVLNIVLNALTPTEKSDVTRKLCRNIDIDYTVRSVTSLAVNVECL